MPTEYNIIALELGELSLVDRPANVHSTVSLFKRAENKEDENMTKVGKNDDKGTALADLVKSLKDQISALGYDVAVDGVVSKKAKEEYLEVSGEMISKSSLPASVVLALEKSKDDAKAAALEKADISLTKMAGEVLPSFDVSVAKSLLSKFSSDDKVMEALKAADAAFDAAMAEVGKEDKNVDMRDHAANLAKAINDIVAKGSVPEHDAYAILAKTPEGAKLINNAYAQ